MFRGCTVLETQYIHVYKHGIRMYEHTVWDSYDLLTLFKWTQEVWNTLDETRITSDKKAISIWNIRQFFRHIWSLKDSTNLWLKHARNSTLWPSFIDGSPICNSNVRWPKKSIILIFRSTIFNIIVPSYWHHIPLMYNLKFSVIV